MVASNLGVDTSSAIAIKRAAAPGTPVSPHEGRNVDHDSLAEKTPVKTPGNGQDLVPNRFRIKTQDRHAMQELVLWIHLVPLCLRRTGHGIGPAQEDRPDQLFA